MDPHFETEPVPEILPVWRYVGQWLDERLEIDMTEYFNLVEEPTNETREPEGLGFEPLEDRENLSVVPEPEPESIPEPEPEVVPETVPETNLLNVVLSNPHLVFHSYVNQVLE
jgi:hypothetical protein